MQRSLQQHQLRVTDIQYMVAKADSAKKAFLICKEKSATWAEYDNEPDPLARFKRYKIVNTNVLTMDLAEAYLDAFKDEDLKLRPNTLACLILEDSYYLFFESLYKKENNV